MTVIGHPTNTLKCTHCGDLCDGSIAKDDLVFCCHGCESVYELLHELDLGEFYTIEEKAGNKPGAREDQYNYLDLPEVDQKLLRFKDDETGLVVMRLPSIHCASCVYLLENLPMVNPGVLSCEVNFVSKKANILYRRDKISLRELAVLLSRIGYAPVFDTEEDHRPAKRRKDLFKLGVAGFCFGNIMLFSFPEYLISNPEELADFRPFFSGLIFALSLPVLVYSGSDYLQSAFKAIRARTINLDVPISIGIMALFIKSAIDILTGVGPGYMDSFAGFVFFLLIGRWFQNRSYEALSFDRDYTSYFPMATTKLEGGEEKVTLISELAQGDRLRIRNDEIIPVDSVLMSDEAMIDYSFVTGESRPVRKIQGQQIFAGGRQTSGMIELEALANVEEGYLASLWQQKVFAKNNEGHYARLTDRLSKIFLWAVLGVAALSGIVWATIEPQSVAEIVTAVLIVSCPCALALALPFTFGHAQRIMGKKGLYLKDSLRIEGLSELTDIVFDKTGTITSASEFDLHWDGVELNEEDKRRLAAICSQSAHPYSRAIAEWAGRNPGIETDHFGEVKGKGIQATVEGIEYRIGSAEWVGQSQPVESLVYIRADDEVLGKFVFGNKYRPGIHEMLGELAGKTCHLISGDNDGEKALLSAFISDENMRFNQQPIDKLKYIESLQKLGRKVLMIGDGLNDAGALKQSDVGLSVAEDIHHFSPACDGIIRADRLRILPEFLHFSRKSRAVLKVCLVFSLLYNLVGLGFAITGALTPLVAAILMPISSITVVALSTFLVTYRSRIYF